MIPTHIAIIMDGNRRWARAHNLPILEGHRRVVDHVLGPLIEHAGKRGVRYLTFWAWSTENWRRTKEEISGIMRLFRQAITTKWRKLHEKGAKIHIIGDIQAFDRDIQEGLQEIVETTKHNTAITTIFALNYGGRDEIVRAIRAIPDNVKNTLDPEQFSRFLDTSGIPDPDLIIRTGGEQRLSGFLLWQSEYSELYFPSWHMPDFTPDRLDEAIEEFQTRKRNFGA